MLNILLTTMMLILPLFILQQDISHKGTLTGLWISLFFCGRLNPYCSIIVFTVAFIQFIFHYKRSEKSDFIVPIKRKSLPQFVFFLASMIIFCASGEVLSEYGTYLQLSPEFLHSASVSGLFASFTGPILFGYLCDKRGPFPATMILILTASSSLGITAASSFSPVLFPISQFILWLSISGCYGLLPVFTLMVLGKTHLNQSAPALVFFLSLLWAAVYIQFHHNWGTTEISATALTFFVYLMLAAAFFSFMSWKNRFQIIESSSN